MCRIRRQGQNLLSGAGIRYRIQWLYAIQHVHYYLCLLL